MSKPRPIHDCGTYGAGYPATCGYIVYNERIAYYYQERDNRPEWVADAARAALFSEKRTAISIANAHPGSVVCWFEYHIAKA